MVPKDKKSIQTSYIHDCGVAYTYITYKYIYLIDKRHKTQVFTNKI